MHLKTLFLSIALTNLIYVSNGQKIPLHYSMFTNLTARGNENVLINAQNVVDPKVNDNVKPPVGDGDNHFTIASIDGGTPTDIYPSLELVIDLKQNFKLSDIYYYHLYGANESIYFYYGTPTNWTSLVESPIGAGYDEWKGLPVNITTRYIKLQITSPGVRVSELVLYGTPIGVPVIEPVPTAAAPEKKTMWEFAGTNLFFDMPDSLAAVSGCNRLYEDLEWLDLDTVNAYPNNLYQFHKFNGDGGIREHLDTVLSRWKRNNNFTYLTIKENSYRFVKKNGHADNAIFWKPIENGANAEDPKSYVEHGDALYQIAARYGSTKVNAANLRVDPKKATKISGYNIVNYIENGNENDKTWKDRKGYYSPLEYAALSSCDYDGHENTLGSTIGIKNADPDMKLVMSGTIAMDTAYVKAMAYWTTHFRKDKRFIWDVINFHHYSNNGGGQGGLNFNTGITPEKDDLYNKLKRYVDFCRKYWPEKEIWWSEFGYDLGPSSQHTPAIPGQTNEQVQANLIVRSFLIATAAGIDRAQQYMLRHASGNRNSDGLFGSSGMVDGWDFTWKPHPSWYAMYTMRSALKNYVFDKIENSSNNNVYLYKFRHISNVDSVAYAVWCPTDNNTFINGFKISIPSLTKADNVTFANTNKTGVRSAIAITRVNGSTTGEGIVSINVSETPQYVLAKVGTVALPVTWISFSGIIKNTDVTLAWLTEENDKTDSYEIQRSIDGINFSKINVVKSRRNSKEYSFTDAAPEKNKYYYRIKQFDIDGEYTYSSIISVTFKTYEENINIYPNPAKNYIVVNQLPTRATIQIFGTSGVNVMTVNANNQKVFTINTSLLKAGVYEVVILKNKRILFTKQVIIKK